MPNLSFEQLFVLVCGCWLFVGMILGWTSCWYWCKYTPEKEAHPTCFGKPITYNGKVENGCDDCPFEIECDSAKPKKAIERMNKKNG